MKILLIGHRGTGKTSLMKRLMRQAQKQGVGLLGIDLDDEIENRTEKPINYFFENNKEAEFREIEQRIFYSLLEEWKSSPVPIVISVGAGCMAEMPNDWEVVWVRRELDDEGRVFLDRPLFDKSKTPLEDYMTRYQERTEFYKKNCHWAFTISEGADNNKANEWRYFQSFNLLSRTVFTLRSEHFESRERLAKTIEVLTRLGVSTLEYRDDLITEEQMESLKLLAADFYTIRSFRKSKENVSLKGQFDYVDWPGEWGGPAIHCDIVSFHERGESESIEDVLKRINKFDDGKVNLKLAVPINSFRELMIAHEWTETGKNRFFYPVSDRGRWQWYRLAFTQGKGLNYIRLDDEVVLDQPTAMEWVNNKFTGNNFFAVIGHPVKHSRSPMEHLDFALKNKVNFYRIDMEPEEWNDETISWLQKNGLIGAAITSPFKEKAFELCKDPDEAIASLNTIIWNAKDQVWRGTNTDVLGLRSFLENLQDLDTVVWGGGGMLHPIQYLLPEAICVSSRSLTVKAGPDDLIGKPAKDLQPKSIIWALGRNYQAEVWPPENWDPRVVFDLNYTEDSPGREYAKKKVCIYHSGLELFKVQAEAQMNYWENHVSQSLG